MTGGDSYRLQDLSVPGSMELIKGTKISYWELDFMEPSGEFIRIFQTDVLREKETYTYISKPAIIGLLGMDFDEEPDTEPYEWAIGWWKYDPDVDYAELIGGDEPDDTLQVKSTDKITFAPGAGFIGNFYDSHSIGINFPAATDVKPQE